jgi:hypothetical protein
VDWVRLAISLIACNLGCDPRCENKVLVPILFLIGGFHLDHLYKSRVTHNETLCMITMFMNERMFTFVNTVVSLFIMFTLCKAFVIFYWTYTNI